MSDTDGTSEPEPTEPGSSRTGPIDPGEPVAPPPPGGYASLRGSSPGIPGGLIVAAVVILGLGFVLGFLVGRAGTDEAPPADERVERNGGGGGQGEQGQGGGGRAARRERRAACRQTIGLGGRLIELQRRALANQVALTEAVVAEDADRIGALTAAGEQLQTRIGRVQGRLDRAAQRCRPG